VLSEFGILTNVNKSLKTADRSLTMFSKTQRISFRVFGQIGFCSLFVFGLLASGLVSANVQEQPKPAAVKQAAKKGKSAKLDETARFAGFKDWVTSVAFDPSGKTLFTGTYESIKQWDVAGKKLTATLKVRSGYAKCLAISADGKTLIAGHYQGITAWNTETHKRLFTLKGHRGYVTDIAFSPNEELLASSSEDGSIRLWNIGSDRKETGRFEGHDHPVNGIAFSPDGKTLASAGGDVTRVTKKGEVILWNVADQKLLHKIVEHKRAATGVRFAPKGDRLISTSEDTTVNIYDIETGKPLKFFGAHIRPTTSAVFVAEGKVVVTGSGGRMQGGNELIAWEIDSGEIHAKFEGHKDKVTALAVSPDGKTLATASIDKTAALWSLGAIAATAQPNENIAAKEDAADDKPKEVKELRAGIIGLDTSHVIAFTKVLNAAEKDAEVQGVRVVAAYPKGSPDIESSTKRVPGYIEQIKKMDVEIVDSIPALLEKVDVVLLETNDGRPHLEQVLPVLKAGKRVFIDKPIAGSLTDSIAIFEAGKHYKTPLFSSSSLRFTTGAQALRSGKYGAIQGCNAHSPCSLEKTHPDFFWYGIHGVETLFTVMGAGCDSVSRATTADFDMAMGVWKDGRIGTFRGIRKGSGGYGGTAFTAKGVQEIGSYDSKRGPYYNLLIEVVKFFKGGEVPISEAETLEIYAFMEAADESKRQGGAQIKLADVMKKARAEADAKLKAMIKD